MLILCCDADAGIVSDAGACCAKNSTAGANVTLDRAGQCCSQGLDVCGVCGGNGLSIDFTGTCCNGAIDASGLCCALPHVVDDFGVCAGNSSTGVIALNLNVLSNSVAGGHESMLALFTACISSYCIVMSVQDDSSWQICPAWAFCMSCYYSDFSSQAHLISGHSRCKDKAIGNQSLHSDCCGIFEQGQFNARMFVLTIAVVVKTSYCTAFRLRTVSLKVDTADVTLLQWIQQTLVCSLQAWEMATLHSTLPSPPTMHPCLGLCCQCLLARCSYIACKPQQQHQVHHAEGFCNQRYTLILLLTCCPPALLGLCVGTSVFCRYLFSQLSHLFCNQNGHICCHAQIVEHAFGLILPCSLLLNGSLDNLQIQCVRQHRGNASAGPLIIADNCCSGYAD